MAIVVNHNSHQRDNNDDFSPHEFNEHGRGHGHGHGGGAHGSFASHGGRGDYDERYNNDNVVDNHNRNDHNRKDHFIEEGRGEHRERRERHGHCDDDRDEFRGHHCCPKAKPPVVQAPVVAVAGGTTVVGAFPERTVIQILNNAALLATYNLVLQPLQKCDTGFIVVETAFGITLLTVTGASNVSPSALTTAGSYIVLKWIGETWVQI
jgi:hypothetical protein